MWREEFLVSGFLGMNLGSDGKDTRGWVGGGGGAAVEEWGHLSHLEFCTDWPPSPALILHPSVSTHPGFAVWQASWALNLKTVLMGPFIPTGVPRGGWNRGS